MSRRRLAAVLLFCAIAVVGLAISLGRPPSREPVAVAHKGHPRLVLAAFQGGLGGYLDPLWIGWKQDRATLEQIQADFRGAQRVRSLSAPPYSYYLGHLWLWFSDGSFAVVQPYLKEGQRSASVLIMTTAAPHTELIRSASLVALVMSEKDFPTPTTPTVSASPSGVVTVRGGAALGTSATILLAPMFRSGSGGVFPEAFPVGTVKVLGGEYEWRGRVALPKGFAVYRPMVGWQVAVQVHPFPKLLQATPGGLFDMPPLPAGVLPILPDSPVLNPSAALAAVRSSALHAGIQFPVWPRGTGRESVSWLNGNGQVVKGTETATATREGSAYQVVVRLTYGRGRVYREAWLVERNGQVTRTSVSGRHFVIYVVLPHG